MSNRRRRTRVDFRTRIDIQATGALLRDLESRDLSQKGVFVLGSHPLEEGQAVYVTVRLHGDEESTPVLHMEGKVARIIPDGTAIDFVAMDPDTYLHLRTLVLLNADDPEETEKEFTQPAFDAGEDS